MARVSRETAASHRAAIVAAASRLFRARGVAAVGVGEITRAAGLTHGGFYGHFASKEALAAEAVTVAFAEGRAGIATRGLHGYLRGYLSRRHRDRPEDGCPLVAFAGTSLEGADEVRGALADGATAMIEAIEGGLAAGLAPAARKAEALRLAALAVGAQVIARALATADPARSDAVLAAARAAIGPHAGAGDDPPAPREADTAPAKG
jgi:TetR/AcrR family transcriptional repressor of nem operon